MRLVHRMVRGWRALGAALGAGMVFQTTGCSPQVYDAFFDLASTVLGQLITSYVSDQLGVGGTGFF